MKAIYILVVIVLLSSNLEAYWEVREVSKPYTVKVTHEVTVHLPPYWSGERWVAPSPHKKLEVENRTFYKKVKKRVWVEPVRIIEAQPIFVNPPPIIYVYPSPSIPSCWPIYAY